jgi:uncharacterized membrane protein
MVKSAAPFSHKRSRNLERLLTIVLVITVLDTAYLSWRFIALHAGWAISGTGICSWSAHIDCDKVLLTSQARAFYVPNAILGFGFFCGCLLWWTVGSRLGEPYRYHIRRMLALWLAVATLFTFWFIWLLIHLDALCPFCPWNHLLTYLALAAALKLWQETPRPAEAMRVKPLVVLTIFCVFQFFLWQVIWIIANSKVKE